MAKTRYTLRNTWGVVIPIQRPYYLQGVASLALPKVDYTTLQGVYQDGETVVSKRLARREFSLNLKIVVENEDDLDFYRDQMAKLLGDFSQPVSLVVTRRDGTERELSIRYMEDTLGTPVEAGKGAVDQDIGYTFIAPSPLWQSPETTVWAFSMPLQTGTFGFQPDGLGFPVGFNYAGLGGGAQAFHYEGTYAVSPVITVHGPCKDLRIENQTTGHKIQVKTGHQINTGELVTIDPRYGQATITSSTGNTSISNFTEDTDIATFCIAAEPTAKDGYNTLLVSTSDADSDTYVRLTFNNLYTSC